MITNKGHPVHQSLVAEQEYKNNYRWSRLPPLLDDKNKTRKNEERVWRHIFSQFREFGAKTTDNYILQIEGWVCQDPPKACQKSPFKPKHSRWVRKTLSACQQCWPESFCESAKFLRHAHYWLKNFWIIWKMSQCYTKYTDKSVRMIWKVSGQSKKCPDNLEKVTG